MKEKMNTVVIPAELKDRIKAKAGSEPITQWVKRALEKALAE